MLVVCQAKSPIRTLDELNVTEVVSPLSFPSIKERQQSNYLAEDSFATSLKSESEVSHVSSMIPSQVESIPTFGMRKQHRCFVVTARARSFLYHQVGVTILNVSNPSLCWSLVTNMCLVLVTI